MATKSAHDGRYCKFVERMDSCYTKPIIIILNNFFRRKIGFYTKMVDLYDDCICFSDGKSYIQVEAISTPDSGKMPLY